MALNSSALIGLLAHLKLTDIAGRIRVATKKHYQQQSVPARQVATLPSAFHAERSRGGAGG